MEMAERGLGSLLRETIMPRKVSAMIQRRIVKMYRLGLTLSKIEDILGVSKTTACDILKDHGVPRRPRGCRVRLWIPEWVQRRVV